MRRFWLIYLGWLAGLIGAISTWLSGWSIIETWWGTQTNLSMMVNGYVLLLTLIIILVFAYRQFQSSRKERYANITTSLHQVMHAIRDIETYMTEAAPDPSDREAVLAHTEIVRGQLEEPLEHLASVFKTITGTNCRACLKLVYDHGGQTYFYTLARDKGSSQRCREMDDERARANHDKVLANPHIAHLLDKSNHSWHFFSNNLARVAGFNTSSLSAYNKQASTAVNSPGPLSFLFHKWPLPYRACMIAVVRQGPIAHKHLNTEIVGFLQVDSEARGVFRERWDAQIVFAVADTFFRPLKRLRDLQHAAGRAAVVAQPAPALPAPRPRRPKTPKI